MKESFTATVYDKMPSFLKKAFHALHEGNQKLQAKRTHNQQTYRILNALLTWLFPMFIVCLAEINQTVKITNFAQFCLQRPGVLLFDFLMSYLMYTVLLMLTNRVWLTAWIQGLSYMTISVVELFKYSTNGNHFKLVDISLAPNVKNLTGFAYIKITLPLVIYVLLLLVVLGVIFMQNPAFTASWRKRLIPALGCTGVYAAVICIPAVSCKVYGIFDVDTTQSQNAFSTNEKFQRNSMLAFLVETTSEKLSHLLSEPVNYSEKLVSAQITAQADQEASAVKPNVIVVMSESFADFRRVNDLNLQTDAYDSFDAVAAEGKLLNVAVPTFASYTVRTEFELMYGLPVRSLMDTITPQKEIATEYPSSMVSLLDEMGYRTAYVHPFIKTFYDRDKVYARYGFDDMIFDEELTVEPKVYGNGYIADETVFNQITEQIKKTDEPLYLHATTMQNHQPYDWIANHSELDVYLEGVRTTSNALLQFTKQLKEINEPTVLIFVGDHFPSMRAEGNLYDSLGIDSENCAVLYEQPAIVWSNTELDTSLYPQDLFSIFYLTPLTCKAAGLPLDAFYETVLGQMQDTKVYTSIFMDETDRNDTLDILTYDRIAGKNFSGTRTDIPEK